MKRLNFLLLSAIILSFCLVYADSTVLSIALPTIQKTFNTTFEKVLWVINSYMLLRAVLVFAAGRISDMFTHIYVFLFGLVVLALSSLACALSMSVMMLIICRALQGIGATFVFVSGMSLITTRAAPDKKARMIGFVLSFSLASMAIAPIIGGLIVKYFSWQHIFFVNVFVSVVAILFSIPSVMEKDAIRYKGVFDWFGFILSVLFTVCFTVAFQNSNAWGGNSFEFIGCVVTGIITFLIFLFVESKKKSPLINLKLFSAPNFFVSCLVASFAQVGVMFVVFISIFLQSALGYSPMVASLLLLPMVGMGIFFSNIGGWLADKFGPRLPLILGTGSVSFGFVLSFFLFDPVSYFKLLPLLIFSGIGVFMINGPIRTAMLNETPADQHGMVNAILTGMRAIISVVGFSITSAIMVNVNYYQTKSQLLKIIPLISNEQIHVLMGLLSHTPQSQIMLNQFDGTLGMQIQSILQIAYRNGFFWGLVFVGILSVASFLLVLFRIRE
jgi:EmrB/QacA subfamily drug resistance transporter